MVTSVATRRSLGVLEGGWLEWLGNVCEDALDRIYMHVHIAKMCQGVKMALVKRYVDGKPSRQYKSVSELRDRAASWLKYWDNAILSETSALRSYEAQQQRWRWMEVVRQIAEGLDPDQSDARTAYPRLRILGHYRIHHDQVPLNDKCQVWNTQHLAREKRYHKGRRRLLKMRDEMLWVWRSGSPSPLHYWNDGDRFLACSLTRHYYQGFLLTPRVATRDTHFFLDALNID